MKKNTYRATDIKEVNIEKLNEEIRGERVVIGLDAAKNDWMAVVMGEDGKVVVTVKWKHPKETPAFVELLRQMEAKSEVALEPTGTYGESVRYQIQKMGLPVYLVSPKKSHDYAEVYDGVPSQHDAKCAAIVAELHKNGKSSIWSERTTAQRDAMAAIQMLDMFMDQYRNNLNRMEALLAKYWPGIDEVIGLDSVTLLSVLDQIGGPTDIRANPDGARQLMRKIGRSLLKPEKIESVIQAAQESLGLLMTKWERNGLKRLAEEILRAKKEKEKAEAEVEELLGSIESAQNMAEVIGKTTATVMVAELGEPKQYGSAKAYEKASGLNLREKSSGKHKGELKITKRGPSLVRKYIYLAVLRLIQTEPVMRAWYWSKVKRDGGKKKGRAIVAIMRKLVRAMWYVGQGKTFDPMLLFDIRRLDFGQPEATMAPKK